MPFAGISCFLGPAGNLIHPPLRISINPYLPCGVAPSLEVPTRATLPMIGAAADPQRGGVPSKRAGVSTLSHGPWDTGISDAADAVAAASPPKPQSL